MVDEKKMQQAREVYQNLCSALDSFELRYTKVEDDLLVHLEISGEDVPVRLILDVDAERQLVRLRSPMPFDMSEDKRMEGAVATCVATYSLVEGCFEYDLSDGMIVFRMTNSFKGRMIGKELLKHMIGIAYATVDQYNDRFLMLNKGMISLADFIAQK